MATIEERMKAFFKTHRVCTADYAYLKSAEEQDPISRAEQKAEDFRKFDSLVVYMNLSANQQRAYEKFKRQNGVE